MIKLKKAMASVVIAAMLATNASFVFAKVPTDVVDTKYEESVQVLNSLGILKGYEDGTFKPENTITRAEFTAVITRAIGLGKNVEGAKGTTSFTDVAADHWASGNINLATNEQIIKGYGDGKFGPEDPVTYEQAVKMIVACLGYTPAAEANGGYPNGYIFEATDLGITKGATAAGNQPATRGIVAKLVFNSLDVDMMEQTSYGSKTKYEPVADKTLLSEKLKVEKVTDEVVWANYMSSLSSASGCTKGKVELRDKEGSDSSKVTYDVGDTNAADYLGYVVDYYVCVDEDSDLEDTILAINKASGNNAELVINARDISSTDPNDRELEYWKDKDKDTDTKTAEFETDTVVIVDGVYADNDFKKFVTDATNEYKDLKSPVQKIKLLDTDTDDKYDVMFVYTVKSYIVESVSSDGTEIDTDDSDSIDLDPSDRKGEFALSITDKDGKSLKATDLQAGDIISVSSDNSSDYSEAKWIDIIVSREKVTGRIDEIDDGDDKDDTDDDLYIIGGKKYYKDPTCDDEIKLGDEGTYSIDAYNNIVDFKLGARSVENYGYLINAAKYDDMDDTVQFNIFNSKGESELYLAALKIKLTAPTTTYKDGVMVDLTQSGKLDAVINLLKDSSASDPNTIKKQLVYFKVNGDGKVSEFQLAFDKSYDSIKDANDPKFDSIKEFKFSQDANVTEDFSKDSDGKSGSFGKYDVDENTLIFYAPKDKTDDDYEFLTVARLIDDKNYKDVQVFDTDSNGVAKAVVIHEPLPLDETDTVAVVKSKSLSKTSAGDDNYKIYAYVAGKEVSIPTIKKDSMDEPNVVEALKEGDVIQYDLNNKGEMRSFAVLFSLNTGNISTSPVLDVYTKYQVDKFDEQELVCGKVYDRDSSYVQVWNKTTNDIEKYKLSGANIYKYDLDYDRLYAGQSTSDIQKSDDKKPNSTGDRYVFIRIYDDKVTDIISFYKKMN